MDIEDLVEAYLNKTATALRLACSLGAYPEVLGIFESIWQSSQAEMLEYLPEEWAKCSARQFHRYKKQAFPVVVRRLNDLEVKLHFSLIRMRSLKNSQ